MAVSTQDNEKGLACPAEKAINPKSRKGGTGTIASTVLTGSDSLAGSLRSKANVSIVTIDPSILEMADVDESLGGRKANLCCGSCCDLLRACIIVNIVFLCYALLTTLGSWFGVKLVSNKLQNLNVFIQDDDYLEAEETDLNRQKIKWQVHIVFLCIGILYSSLGIAGAARFKTPIILVVAIMYTLDAIAQIVLFNHIGALLRGFFAYPHYAFFRALIKEKITRENYATTERYCCCDTKV